MSQITTIPSAWVLAYLVGMGVCFYRVYKTDKFELMFVLCMIYMLALSIGLKTYYG